MTAKVYAMADGWYYENVGIKFGTKGGLVAYMRDQQGMSWGDIAAAIPGGTRGNCQSVYRHIKAHY